MSGILFSVSELTVMGASFNSFVGAFLNATKQISPVKRGLRRQASHDRLQDGDAVLPVGEVTCVCKGVVASVVPHLSPHLLVPTVSPAAAASAAAQRCDNEARYDVPPRAVGAACCGGCVTAMC